MNKLALNTYAHDPVKKIGNAFVKNFIDEVASFDAGSNAKLCRSSSRVPAKSGTSTIFSGTSAQIDYELIGINEICHIDDMVLRLPITNNDASNAALLLPGEFMIDYFQVMVDGGVKEQPYSLNAFYNDLYLANDDEEIRNNQALVGFTGGVAGTPYAASVSLAASASTVIYIPLRNVLTKSKMFISASTSQITIRIYFDSTGMLSTSTSSGISVGNADLLIAGFKYDDTVKNALLKRYRSLPHVLPYYQPQRFVLSGRAISDTSPTTLNIGQGGGFLSSQLVVMVLPQNAVKQNLYNFQAVSLLNYQRDGKSFYSFETCPADWWKRQMADLFNVSTVSSENVYVISQSKTPVESAKYGVQRGADYLTSNDQLQIQMPTGASGTYDVYILCYRFQTITIGINGALTFQDATKLN